MNVDADVFTVYTGDFVGNATIGHAAAHLSLSFFYQIVNRFLLILHFHKNTKKKKISTHVISYLVWIKINESIRAQVISLPGTKRNNQTGYKMTLGTK